MNTDTQEMDEWDAQEQREAREEQIRWENRDNDSHLPTL